MVPALVPSVIQSEPEPSAGFVAATTASPRKPCTAITFRGCPETANSGKAIVPAGVPSVLQSCEPPRLAPMNRQAPPIRTGWKSCRMATPRSTAPDGLPDRVAQRSSVVVVWLLAPNRICAVIVTASLGRFDLRSKG